MLWKSYGIVEGVAPGSGHGESAGSRLQHAALDGAESRRRLRAVVDVAAEGVLAVVNGPEVFHGGVARIDHHVAVMRVQPRVHQGGGLRGGVLGGAVVRVGSGGVHLRPVRVGSGGGRQTVACLASPRRTVPSAAHQVSPQAALSAVSGRDSSAGSQQPAGSLLRPVAVLLHVFGQVGFLGVALPAELADVCLEVFRLLVLGNVVEERVLVDEALVAGVALVRLVRLVAARVGLEV